MESCLFPGEHCRVNGSSQGVFPTPIAREVRSKQFALMGTCERHGTTEVCTLNLFRRISGHDCSRTAVSPR